MPSRIDCMSLPLGDIEYISGLRRETAGSKGGLKKWRMAGRIYRSGFTYRRFCTARGTVAAATQFGKDLQQPV